MTKHPTQGKDINVDKRKIAREEHTYGSRRADAPRDAGHDAGGKK